MFFEKDWGFVYRSWLRQNLDLKRKVRLLQSQQNLKILQFLTLKIWRFQKLAVSLQCQNETRVAVKILTKIKSKMSSMTYWNNLIYKSENKCFYRCDNRGNTIGSIARRSSKWLLIIRWRFDSFYFRHTIAVIKQLLR